MSDELLTKEEELAIRSVAAMPGIKRINTQSVKRVLGCLDAIRAVLGMPDASVSDCVAMINSQIDGLAKLATRAMRPATEELEIAIKYLRTWNHSSKIGPVISHIAALESELAESKAREKQALEQLAKVMAEKNERLLGLLERRVRDFNQQSIATHRTGDHFGGRLLEERADFLVRQIDWLKSETLNALSLDVPGELNAAIESAKEEDSLPWEPLDAPGEPKP